MLGEIGRGGMACVLDAVDERDGQPRAIKLMLPGPRAQEVAQRMEREYLALARLRHPAILRVHDHGTWRGRPWFACERLRGQELGELVEGWRNLSPTERFERAVDILRQLAEALAFIHDQGMVHRDLTPSNVMVEADGRVRLMDFGVVKELGVEATQAGEVVGTVAWIAPEQIRGEAVDGRTDLYALGGIFYLMLTGRRPFHARNLAGFLDKHLHRAPRPPRELAPTLPERLDELCLRLLAKDPDARFASARHLLLALDDRPLDGLVDPEPGHLPMAGRAAALIQLREAVSGAAHGGGVGLILLEAADGMGKTRLANEAVAQARAQGVGVSRLRGTGDPRPFSGVQGLLDALEERGPLGLSPALRARMEQGLTQDQGPLVQALAELLDRHGPRLLVIDDAQRVDRASLHLLTQLLTRRARREGPALLVLLTRDTAEPAPTLERAVEPGGVLDRAGVELRRLALQPVPLAAVEELLLHLVVDSPAARVLAARLHGDGEGNPLLLVQMLRALREQGLIEPGDGHRRGSLRLDEAAATRAPLPVPASIRQGLLVRLASVREDARRVIELLAVAREPLEPEVIRLASAPLEEATLAGQLSGLAAAGLVRIGEATGGRYTLARHRLGDVLLEELAPARRRELHGRLARALEQRHRRNLGPVVGSIAEHYVAAGYPAVAWPYLVRAAALLMEQGEVGLALERLETGLRLEPQARGFLPLAEADRLLAEALRMRASARIHLGAWEEAEADARAAWELGRLLEDPALAARAATELGALGRRRHDLPMAGRWLDEALRLARATGQDAVLVPALYELGGLHWSRGELEAARQPWEEVLRRAEVLGDERMQALGSNGLGVLALCGGDAAQARRSLERAVDLSARHGMAERLVVGRINLVELHHLTGNLRKAHELAQLAVSEARESDLAFGLALGLRYRALVLVDTGQLTEARENAREAVRMQQALGNPEEELSARLMLAREALHAGDAARLERELAACGPLLAHDTEGMAPVLLCWWARVRVVQGRPDEARRLLEEARAATGRPWPHQRLRLLLSLARAHEALGEPGPALAHAEEALRISESCGYRLYGLKARRIAARTSADEANAARHARVADALQRSLAATLQADEAQAPLSEPATLR